MLKKSAVLLAMLTLAACASSQPRVIQSSGADGTEITLKPGQVTQIEMPDQGHVQSITVGNPDLVGAEQSDDVVNLVVKQGTGETNMIIRSREDGDIKVYQYHIVVKPR